MMLDTGQKRIIYEDPVTCEKSEGEAILRELYSTNGLSSHWRVEFVDEPGVFYERTIVSDEEIAAEATEERCG